MRLVNIPPAMVSQAWVDGAHQLGKACERSGGEITGDQLKEQIEAGEWTLLATVDDAGRPAGWAAVGVQQRPNLRALYVQAIYAPGATSVQAFELLGEFGRHNGCQVIRGACGPGVARLWARRFAARAVYTTMEIAL